MSTSAGTKVTTDAASNQAIPEAVGTVTSDSLAAESLKSAGAFGEGNPKAAASKQPSHSTTTNTTDTSSAREIPPAVDAEAREARDGWSEAQQLSAGKGLGKESGVGPTYNTTTGASTSATGGLPGTGSTGGSGFPNGGGGSVTGGYAGAADSARVPGEFQPKGTNVQEGGFDAGAPNALFNGAEPGSKDDPARLAQQKFQLSNSQAGADGAGAARQGEVTGETAFDALESEQNA
ncbi:hypothetical protein BU24DRAFT_221188 [Aaosphaeria arxii CBS 175.79]|uniref:SMP domain-containing protein n=1 Tax=Aaosphaeria arxii CBS 175.79 TaxID=1450172 RepID=A0A6A5XPF1_9PLEO|nr:uncharacterized protein BU24DRAFT_221188 [Aaosphaeria arxii CBS 175.79]KAF2014779.1 hypothetical protein BU24DRAFT_221188 [Aaosphaeria arxii CBS 175.79]